MSPVNVLIPALLAASLAGAVGAQETPGAWRFQVELGFNGASGNSSFSILRTGASIRYLRTDRAKLEISGLLRYGRSDGTVIANDARTTVKFDLNPKSDFSPFLYVTNSRDRIRKLDLRSNGGFGANYTFWRGTSGKASLSLAGIFDYENFRVEPGSGGDRSEGLARWSGRLSFDQSFGSGTEFRHTTQYQPVWNGFGDYLVNMSNRLTTKIMDNLALAVEHEYLHDEVPPPGVKPDDQKFSVLLRATFQ